MPDQDTNGPDGCIAVRVPVPDKPIEVSPNVSTGVVPQTLAQTITFGTGAIAAYLFKDGNVSLAAMALAPALASVAWVIWNHLRRNRLIGHFVNILPNCVAKYKDK